MVAIIGGLSFAVGAFIGGFLVYAAFVRVARPPASPARIIVGEYKGKKYQLVDDGDREGSVCRGCAFDSADAGCGIFDELGLDCCQGVGVWKEVVDVGDVRGVQGQAL